MADQAFLLPTKAIICEVAPRDGFQAEPEWIPTDKKVEMIRSLAKTGITTMEVTSFVHPKAIPQLKDAEEVVSRVHDIENLHLRALVPNLTGAQRAVNAGVKKLKLMLSATDSHSLSNANATVIEAQNKLEPIIEYANQNDTKVGGSISVAFGCPYEGKVGVNQLIPILDRYQKMGIEEVSLADTTGMATPKQVYETLGVLKETYPTLTFSMHFHNTRGMALANTISALQQGVIRFDSSIAGLGGCPYAPGASGNVATEDLVHFLHENGVDTGINLSSVITTAKEVKNIIGHDGGSFILQAGPSADLHSKPKSQQKINN
ncbi:hydroxymethylglutaryl-CoA lyase [Oceanobacillus iheyensis HTE831]|uniref:Hydroxymethylglutaryl-CoA lyase n=1 Tax=Oceanobacillus iheyensis (strain DSM 14371 / CIP 107618 / JCM 11309 / KCTC 3954 / HTE831) TaxID=221109 RepID=Q8ELJ7_OCEIH|nr:hydroxymethylglutaryl-CoA lyase [Oceanobacillus iheyensis]BAC15186.1 hydroxymethylglutaryl-CoA lyase [Oceanobacillus iheyensis HTE831]